MRACSVHLMLAPGKLSGRSAQAATSEVLQSATPVQTVGSMWRSLGANWDQTLKYSLMPLLMPISGTAGPARPSTFSRCLAVLLEVPNSNA